MIIDCSYYQLKGNWSSTSFRLFNSSYFDSMIDSFIYINFVNNHVEYVDMDVCTAITSSIRQQNKNEEKVACIEQSQSAVLLMQHDFNYRGPNVSCNQIISINFSPETTQTIPYKRYVDN